MTFEFVESDAPLSSGEEKAATLSATEAGADSSPKPALTYKLLLVSDDCVIAPAIAASMRAAGHQAFCVKTGEEALRCFQRDPYDLIASKFDLPGMDGEELACWVKALDPRQRFILVTNARDGFSGRSAADLVLRKPFTLQQATEAFYNLMASRAAR